MKIQSFVVAFSATLAIHAMAQAQSAPAAAPVRVLEEKTQGEVTWLCGGVGLEESTYLKEAARDHDLVLTFATRKGEYMADVKVAIDDAQGRAMLRTTCDGPMMLVNLPRSGSYKVRSEANGVTREMTAKVNTEARKAKGAPARLVMTWPEAAEEQVRSTGSSEGQGQGKPR